MAAAIEMRDLTKFYGSARGIDRVNLTIEEGEIFGYIGPNGAGKTTTIRTLLSLIYATSGSATIFGKDIVRDRDQILQQVGYLPGEVFYYDGMRVIDLLNYSASFYKKDCSARIRELAEILELDLKRKIDDLSYGNRKKVGIVQGLLHSPRLLILDEPTSGLDPLMQARFFELIKAENRNGVTVLFSSHILSEVQNICDRVGIIKDGRIVQIEKISVLRESAYKKVALSASQPLDAAAFADLGTAGLEISDHNARFLHSGNINLLLQHLAGLPLTNLTIEEPSLEELFMHYYK